MLCFVLWMNIYVGTIMNMAHQGVKSEIQIRSDNTTKAHQMTAVKWIQILIETIMNMAHRKVKDSDWVRQYQKGTPIDNSKMNKHI